MASMFVLPAPIEVITPAGPKLVVVKLALPHQSRAIYFCNKGTIAIRPGFIVFVAGRKANKCYSKKNKKDVFS